MHHLRQRGGATTRTSRHSGRADTVEDHRPAPAAKVHSSSSSCHVNTTRDAIERHKLECNVVHLGLDPAGRHRVVLSSNSNSSSSSTSIIHQTISLSLSLPLSLSSRCTTKMQVLLLMLLLSRNYNSGINRAT